MTTGALQGVERVPREFLAQLDPPDPPTRDALVSAAAAEMARALSLPPKDRRAAWALLAADAYLTWACSMALQEGGGPDGFRTILAGFLSSVPESQP